VVWVLWGYVHSAEAFRVVQVHSTPQTPFTLPASLIGTNLFTVDLRALSMELQQQQPWWQAVRVVRHVPHTIRIHPVPRVAVAQVDIPPISARRADRAWYPVARDGVILPEGRAEPVRTLVRIVGCQRDTAQPERLDERFTLALRVLTQLMRSPRAISRRVRELNVADPQQIRFVLDDDVEVRCGREEELDAHLVRLRAALQALKGSWFDSAHHDPERGQHGRGRVEGSSVEVGYLDVRFQDPVIGPREA
jgi:hypothetical protein